MHWIVQQTQYPGFVHSGALNELTEAIVQGLSDLGHAAELRVKSTSAPTPWGQSSNLILIGAHLMTPWECALVPDTAVVYNTEHFNAEHVTDHYVELLKRTAVWDYNQDNARMWSQRLGHVVRYVPYGYIPQHTCIEDQPNDIDVLFYGWLTARRRHVLDECVRRGLTVYASEELFGRERSSLIARAKIVLNMHCYLPGFFELLRVGYLLANRKAVISEINENEGFDPVLTGGFLATPYEQIADVAHALVRDDSYRCELENTGFTMFTRRSQADILREIVNE